MAARWSEKHPQLKGTALENEMQQQPWDTSVKGLTSVPQVLAMMNDKLDWTQQLGEAFLAQPDDVQKAIQALRAQADATGNLKSSKEQKVRRVAATPGGPDYVGPPEYIVIEPMEPDYIYVTVYDPTLVFGVDFWPPDYVPFFWHPPWWTVGPVFGFGPLLFVGPALWCDWNWGHPGFAAVRINSVRYSQFNKVAFAGAGQSKNWHFDPGHRGNVSFKNTKLQQQYGKAFQGGKALEGKAFQGGKALQGRKDFQGGKALEGKAFQGGKALQGRKDFQGGKALEGKAFQGGKALEGRKDFQGGDALEGKSFQGGKALEGRKALQGDTGFKSYGGSGSGFKAHGGGGGGFKAYGGGGGGGGFKMGGGGGGVRAAGGGGGGKHH